MKIEVEQVQAGVPVTVMMLDGELDATNYQDVIAKTRDLYQEGTRNLLVDLELLSFMSSAGLVALHNAALLMRGEGLPNAEGWSAYHEVSHFVNAASGHEAHCKILNPQPTVDKTLEVAGFKNVFDIFADRDEALASFE